MQNVSAGHPIKKLVRNSDAASWPKTILPPHKNFCQEEKFLVLVHMIIKCEIVILATFDMDVQNYLTLDGWFWMQKNEWR